MIWYIKVRYGAGLNPNDKTLFIADLIVLIQTRQRYRYFFYFRKKIFIYI